MTTLAYVVDASVAVKLFLTEAHSQQAVDLFDWLAADPSTTFHVPDLFYAECANILWKQCQWGTKAPAQAQADYADLCSLRLHRIPAFDLGADALLAALTFRITAYDACYVVLAGRLGIPLITADQKLIQKLAGSPYTLVWLGNWTPVAGSGP